MPFDFPTLLKAFRIALRKEHFSLRYSVAILFFITVTLFARCVVQFGRLLDRLLFADYRFQQIRAPLFIIAGPRSGTTFLHRLLCMDDQFTYFKLYHTLLPSVALIKLIGVLGRADRWLNGTFVKVANRLSRLVFKGWIGIHETLLTEAEEDEQFFLYTLLSPSFFMFFPFMEELAHLKFIDRMPRKTRLKLMDYYRDCLKRHIFATGPQRTLLAKNVLIQGRLRAVMKAIPDMRIVYLVRNPYAAIPSFVSMYSAMWRLLSPELAKSQKHARELAKLLCDYYAYFEEIKSEFPSHQLIEVRYEDLVTDPEGTVKRIYRKFGLKLSGEFLRILKRESARAAGYKSAHKYTLEDLGLSEAFLRKHLKDCCDPEKSS